MERAMWERGRKEGMQKMRRNGGRERKGGSWKEGREVARDVVRETNMVISCIYVLEPLNGRAESITAISGLCFKKRSDVGPCLS
jgi:hypothetical protein